MLVPEGSMRKKTVRVVALAFFVQVAFLGATCQARTQAEKAPYPAMAHLDQYLMPDENSEIALARSAAQASVSDGAEVMVLGPKGYTTAAKGTNGFLCIVERSWGAATDDLEFQSARPDLLQSASCKDLCAHLSDEDQTGGGREI
jgi:hypothetical protein